MTAAKIGSIIAATDFSPPADRALRRAASLAQMAGGALHLIHVLPPRELLAEFFLVSPQIESAAFRTRSEQALQARAHRIAAEFSVMPSWALFHGEAHQEILGAVALLAADVVVLGAQGEHEASLPSESVGDTAMKLAERSPVPTLLVRRPAQAPYGHVVACAKGVQADGRVIDWAARLSPSDLIHVVSAYPVPYENRLIEWGASQSTIDVYATREREERTRVLSGRLKELGLPAARARLHVERGEPVPTILHHATQWEADLLIVGRRAQAHSLTQGVFASVARHIALRAPTDVMIVSPAPVDPAGDPP